MGGLARAGVSLNDQNRIAFRGYAISGMAAAGQTIWTPPGGGWKFLTETNASGIGAVSPPIDTTGADLLVAAVAAYSTTIFPLGMNDSFGNTWNVLRGTSGAFQASILWSKPTSVGQNHTFQALPASGDWFPSFVVAALSGSDAAPLDQFAVNAVPANIVSITPSAPSTAILTVVCLNAAGTPSINAPFTIIHVSPWVNGVSMGCALAGFLQEEAVTTTATWAGGGPSASSMASFFENPIRVLPT